MHELSICQALIAQVEAVATDRRSAVRRVCLGIGPLAGVEPQLLKDAYPLVCAGTVAEGSQLDIKETAIRVRCRNCGAETAATANRLVCGVCGDWRTDLIAGDEMLLLRVELETPNDAMEDADV
ncbi:MAG: hydrogenase nickel incorporation protein HypA [Rhodopseudomonas sp.]|nr:hydrogenase nickel incorporation protein HypA [Rhodopseudomonas sp.]